MTKLPKFTFKQMPLEMEAEMFFEFLDVEYWGKRITDKYPQFLEIKEIKVKKDKLLKIKTEISKIRKEQNEILNKDLEAIISRWKIVEVDILKTLPEIIQTDWSDREITAYISINPVCPRFLDSWSFSISSDYKDTNLVIAHEILHFLFFKKFHEIFPKISMKNYEAPHKEWLLSELVAVIISFDPRILEITGVKDDFYQSHKKLSVDGELITEKLEKLYKEYVLDKNNFTEFLRVDSV